MATQQMRDTLAAYGIDTTGMSDAQVESAYEQVVAIGPVPGAAEDEPEIIGDWWSGPPTVVNQGTPLDPWLNREIEQGRLLPDRLRSPYYEGSSEESLDELRSKSPERFTKLQEELLTLGLSPSAIPGQIDDGTVLGMTRLLALSNRNGRTWQSTLRDIRIEYDKGNKVKFDQDRRPEQVYTRQVPDYNSLKQVVRQTFMDELGRDPTQAEMHIFSDELMADYAESEDARIAAMREADRVVEVPEDNVGAGRVVNVPEIDPISRFEETFRSRFRPEVLSNQRQESTGMGAAVAQQQVSTVSSLAGS